MKIWQVSKGYFDGDHDHGYYNLGLYTSKEAAMQAAENAAMAFGADRVEWHEDVLFVITSCPNWGDDIATIYIKEQEVHEQAINFNEEELKKRLRITYT